MIAADTQPPRTTKCLGATRRSGPQSSPFAVR